VVAVGVLLVAAGCGGDDDARTRYARDAQRICRQADTALGPVRAEISRAQRLADSERVFSSLGRLIRERARTALGFVERLDALPAPGAQRDRLKSWIADLRRRAAMSGQLADAYGRKDTAAVATLAERIDALDQRTGAFARRFGMPACAAPAR
jgi:hypothetical protein